MSIKLISEMLNERQVPSGAFSVLLALCEIADDPGYCYPSIAHIAWKVQLSERSVMRSLAKLEEAGAVKIKRRYKRASIYKVVLSALPAKEKWRGDYDLDREILDWEQEQLQVSPDNLSPKTATDVTAEIPHLSPETATDVTLNRQYNRDYNREGREASADAAPEPPLTLENPAAKKPGRLEAQVKSKKPKINVPKQEEKPKEPERFNGRPIGIVHALARAFFMAKGLDNGKIDGGTRARTVAAFKTLPEAFTMDDVEGCTRYMMTDPWWQEPGKLTPYKLMENLPEWQARGRPEAKVPARAWERRNNGGKLNAADLDQLLREADGGGL